jgi:hypothetical protein
MYKYCTSGHDVLFGVCEQKERKRILGKLERAREKKQTLESLVARYQKIYPQFADTEAGQADDQVSQVG